MTTPEAFEELRPSDPPMCGRFGSGAFPCGPAFKVRVTQHDAGAGRGLVTRRHVVCEAHFVFLTSRTHIPGGPSGFKVRAKTIAMQRLAAAHLPEFQGLYETALAELCAKTEPPINPDLLLGRSDA